MTPKEETQTKLDQISGKSSSKVSNAALVWIINDMFPFSTVNTPAFRTFVLTVNPLAQVPCAATLRDRLAQRASLIRGNLKAFLTNTLEYGSITTDSWSSNANKPYIAVTLHWLDEDFKIHECCLSMAPQPYPHDAQTTALLLRRFCGL
jgi:hypothetical protein